MLYARWEQKLLVLGKGWKRWVQIGAAAVILLSPLYMKWAFDYGLSYGMTLVVSNLLSMLVAISLCHLLYLLFSLLGRAMDLFAWIGKYSMEVYCIHMIFVGYLPIRLPAAVFTMPEIVPDICYLAVAMVMALTVAALSRYLLNRIPIYRYIMLGQWSKSSAKKKGD